ncbi:response regulator [Velocimicrobium porci]|uniref:Stage 0 sporulation protein A homolog n=1 Tax=Velocimicrobium porci TaxID=2606634 RepID=A0A6L5XZR5_9FIRM|nr:response regulator [Velocimicrobium porci]MSS64222.1 response regulator [Velocimicrobium porci]
MKKTILVIDDSPFASQQIKDVVEEHGYEVIDYARNGEEGIEKYKEIHPDFVILDIIMPGIGGLETAEILLKEDPKAKIMMLSSLCDSGTLEEVKSIGLKYLIPKPLDEDVLLATLELLKKNG